MKRKAIREIVRIYQQNYKITVLDYNTIEIIFI